MDSPSTAEAPAAPHLRDRSHIPDRFKWDLTDIFPGWAEWQRAYEDLEVKIGGYAALQGTLAKGADRLLAAMKLSDDIGQLTYKVWYFASLKHDEDQRDNQLNARRQQVQILFAKTSQATAWFNPELLSIPLPAVQQWMADNTDLALYRFALEDLYRQQEHVLDEKGEHLLSLSSRFSSSPYDAYAALSTADIKHPTIKLSTGPEITLTYGQYRPSSRPTAARAIAPPRFANTTSSSRRTSTPTRRSTAESCSVTGSTRNRAGTGPRSNRRSTATTSPQRSSRISSRPQRGGPSRCGAITACGSA